MNPELVDTFNRVHGPKGSVDRNDATCGDGARRSSIVSGERHGSYGLSLFQSLKAKPPTPPALTLCSRNYLLTIESFSLMVRRLEAAGVIVIHTWMNTPPRGSIKALGTLIEALRSNGIEIPGIILL